MFNSHAFMSNRPYSKPELIKYFHFVTAVCSQVAKFRTQCKLSD